MTVKIEKAPEGLTNGDLMTQFTDTVGKKGETFTFPEQQNHVFVQNEGDQEIYVEVAGVTKALRPGENFGQELDYTSVKIKAIAGEDDETQQFSVYGTQHRLQGQNVAERTEVSKPGTNATVGDEENLDDKPKQEAKAGKK